MSGGDYACDTSGTTLLQCAEKSFAFTGGSGIFSAASGSGRSVAWLARLFRVQEVVSSNLTAPTIFSPALIAIFVSTACTLRLPGCSVAATKWAVLSDQEFLRVVDATPLVSIDLILRNARDEVLLGRRLNRPAKDSWFVPGGRIRKNERVREALHRISEREIGVLIEEAELLGVFDHIYEDNFLGVEGVNTHYVVLGFAARLRDGVKLTPDDQHGELGWWSVSEILASTAVHENTKAYFRTGPRA